MYGGGNLPLTRSTVSAFPMCAVPVMQVSEPMSALPFSSTSPVMQAGLLGKM